MPQVLGSETHAATGLITFGTQTLGVNTSGQLTLNGTAQRLVPAFVVPTLASFTSVNLGTGGTLTGGNNAPLVLFGPQAATTGTFDVRFAYLATSGTWTVTALLDVLGPAGNAYHLSGLVTYNTSTSALSIFGAANGGGAGGAGIAVNNFTGYSAQTGVSGGPGLPSPAVPWNGSVWLRITCNGTTLSYYVSNSGLANTWYLLGTQTFTAAGSPNAVGFGIAPQNQNSVTGNFQIALQNWEKAASIVTAGSAYGFPG